MTHTHHQPLGRPGALEVQHEHPGNLGLMRQVIVGEGSPVYLPSLPPDGHGYWITSPGLGWARVPAIQTGGGGVNNVTLRPAATLEVMIEDLTPKRGLCLALLAEDGHVITVYRHIAQPDHLIAGLPPGDCELVLTFDEALPSRETAIATSGALSLLAGKKEHVSIQMPRLPGALELGALAGTVSVTAGELWSDTMAFRRAALVLTQEPPSPGYAALEISKTRLRIASMERVGGAQWGNVFFWEIDGVPAGEYELTVSPLGLSVPVLVEAGETTQAEVIVPPLARTVVETWSDGTLVEEATVVAFTPESGTTFMAEVGEEQGGAEGTKSLYTVLSLPGDIRIAGRSPGFPSFLEEVSVQEGWNHVRIELERYPAIVLRAVNKSGEEVEVTWWKDVEVGPVSGLGEVVERLVERPVFPKPGGPRARLNLFFSKSGRYRIEFPETSGGVAAEQLEVSVTGGPTATLVDVVVP